MYIYINANEGVSFPHISKAIDQLLTPTRKTILTVQWTNGYLMNMYGI